MQLFHTGGFRVARLSAVPRLRDKTYIYASRHARTVPRLGDIPASPSRLAGRTRYPADHGHTRRHGPRPRPHGRQRGRRLGSRPGPGEAAGRPDRPHPPSDHPVPGPHGAVLPRRGPRDRPARDSPRPGRGRPRPRRRLGGGGAPPRLDRAAPGLDALASDHGPLGGHLPRRAHRRPHAPSHPAFGLRPVRAEIQHGQPPGVEPRRRAHDPRPHRGVLRPLAGAGAPRADPPVPSCRAAEPRPPAAPAEGDRPRGRAAGGAVLNRAALSRAVLSRPGGPGRRPPRARRPARRRR